MQFKEIARAFEVLSNPKTRELYDQGGEEALKEGGNGGGSGQRDDGVCYLDITMFLEGSV